MVFSLFELNELKERVDSVRFANSALSRFEDVEVKGLDNDVEHVGTLIEAKVVVSLIEAEKEDEQDFDMSSFMMFTLCEVNEDPK